MIEDSIEFLCSELKAILFWDEAYKYLRHPDEIDRDAFAMRRLRLTKIKRELERLRRMLPLPARGKITRQ